MGHTLRWVALFGISVLAFTVFLDFTIVNTALPFIQKTFRISVLQLQWIPNIFSMVLTATMVAAGRFADLHGRKKVFYWGVLIFAVAAFGAGFSPSIGILTFFRGLQGVGGSIVFVSSASLITNIFPKQGQGHAIGIYGGITGLGLAIGPVIGGLLVHWLSWRWVFWINLPLIAVGFALCLLSLKLPPHVKPEKKIDKKGLSLLIVGLGSLIYGIIAIAERGLNSIVAWLFLCIGMIVLTLFIFAEKRSKEPLVDFSLFKKKLIVLITLSVSLAGVVSYVFMFFDPLYLRILRHLSALQIGLFIAAIPIAQVVISFVFPFLLKWLGTPKLMIISVAAALLAILAHRGIGLHTPLGLLVIPFAILGINWGLSNAGMISGVNECIAPTKISEAIGSICTVWNLVGSVFLALSSAIFHVWQKPSFLEGFHAAINFNAVFALLVLGSAIFVYRKI